MPFDERRLAQHTQDDVSVFQQYLSDAQTGGSFSKIRPDFDRDLGAGSIGDTQHRGVFIVDRPETIRRLSFCLTDERRLRSHHIGVEVKSPLSVPLTASNTSPSLAR